MALVLDTGVLYGALDESDPDHAACAALVEETPEQLLIPVLVLGELDYWVRKFASADAWLTFCQDIREGAYTIYQLDSQLLLAAAQVEARFADLGVGLVDASVVVTCESIGETRVATLDRRHFSVLRTSDGKALDILPA